MEKTITITEGQLKSLVTESVRNILSEGFFEGFFEGSNGGDKDKNKESAGLSAQATDILNDPTVNNAELGRELKDQGVVHGSEDTIRGLISKWKRGERKIPKGGAPAIVNIMSSD